MGVTDYTIKVLDKGYVSLLSAAGPSGPADDCDPANCARVSFDARDTRTREDDLRLNRYLWKHRHCYHPDMQVLTADGWVKWRDAGDKRTFLVPDPKTRTLHEETLDVNKFQVDDTMITMENHRMSYCVTPEHRMWFKPKYSQEFGVHEASTMPSWGHFDPFVGYMAQELCAPDREMEFVGFYLGDGSWSSTNTLTFHLKKQRKIDYLEELIENLGLSVKRRPSSTHQYGVVFIVDVPGFLRCVTDDAISHDKRFLGNISSLTPAQRVGLWTGLRNSDGHISTIRSSQTQFSSTSDNLLKTFEALSAYLGMDAHRTVTGITAYSPETRTSLECRKDYLSLVEYEGDVFCATSSTGLLVVRGRDSDFAFICGNSTPFEMVVTWWEMKLPIFVARQLMRHRTASINETSRRYVDDDPEIYYPDRWRPRAADKKQGSSDEPLHHMAAASAGVAYFQATAEALAAYRKAIAAGVAPEMARMVLPVSAYTKWIWKQDLHNLLHMLKLRSAPDAQWETRQYADAMIALLRQRLPDLMEVALCA